MQARHPCTATGILAAKRCCHELACVHKTKKIVCTTDIINDDVRHAQQRRVNGQHALTAAPTDLKGAGYKVTLRQAPLGSQAVGYCHSQIGRDGAAAVAEAVAVAFHICHNTRLVLLWRVIILVVKPRRTTNNTPSINITLMWSTHVTMCVLYMATETIGSQQGCIGKDTTNVHEKTPACQGRTWTLTVATVVVNACARRLAALATGRMQLMLPIVVRMCAGVVGHLLS